MELRREHLLHLFSEAAILLYRHAPGFEARISPTSYIVLSGEPVPDLNLAGIAAGLDAEERIREQGEIIHDRGLPLLVLIASEVAHELAPIAHELRLDNAGSVPLAVFEPTSAPRPSPGFTVEHVEDSDGLAEANRIRAAALSIPADALERVFPPETLDTPGVNLFLCRRDGQPIGTAWSTQHGPVVGIWSVCIAPERRDEGAGTALLTGVVAHHYERGARHFYLGVGTPGAPLFEHVGFQRLGELSVWIAGMSGDRQPQPEAAAHA
jgi:GNAT superfamily N-acetyltransferase